VVPLSLGFVQTGEDLQLRHFALTIVNMLTQVVKKPQVSDDHSWSWSLHHSTVVCELLELCSLPEARDLQL
jgi:hypothetical protein